MKNKLPSWFVVYTKPRQEHVALEYLERQGFHCFLPMAIKPYQRLLAKVSCVEPLFPRCLFLNANADEQSGDSMSVELGDMVNVFDGPMAELEGIFKERKGEKRVLLLASLLGTESTIEVDALMLQKAV